MRRFLVDNQLSAALARWLETKGCAADHVLALGLAQASDAELWRHAARAGAVIVSKDEDFARMTLLQPEPVAVVSGCASATVARRRCSRRWSAPGRPLSSNSMPGRG